MLSGLSVKEGKSWLQGMISRDWVFKKSLVRKIELDLERYKEAMEIWHEF